MGILRNLFGGKNDLPGKTGEMMDEDRFWNIVATSLKFADDQEKQEEFLISSLSKLPPKDIIGFRLRTDKLLFDTYNDKMWCAAYIMNGGCSDDGFEYFRCWVISRGKEVYYAAKENPDSLISQVNEDEDEDDYIYEFESFWSAPLDAFEQVTKKSLYDFIDDDVFKTSEGNYPAIEFSWQEDDPGSMRKICPRLFAAKPI
ncbi:MAG: polymerase [Citrobacter freundii]|nr:MAG: polymerase [Citrobacter freundii]